MVFVLIYDDIKRMRNPIPLKFPGLDPLVVATFLLKTSGCYIQKKNNEIIEEEINFH